MCFVVLISCDLWNFSTQKKNTFLWEDFVQLIIISSYMTYAFSCLGTLPFCILFHELEVDSQVNYVSIFSLRTYSVCTYFMWITWLKNQQPGLRHSISMVTFFSTPLLTREKNPDCRLPAASTYLEPCVSIYCTGLLYGLLYLKNKQVDISTTFCFSETISWLTSVTILIMMKLLLCQTARMPLLPFLSQRLIGLPIMWRPLPSLTIPCRVKWKRFTKKPGERLKRIGLV